LLETLYTVLAIRKTLEHLNAVCIPSATVKAEVFIVRICARFTTAYSEYASIEGIIHVNVNMVLASFGSWIADDKIKVPPVTPATSHNEHSNTLIFDMSVKHGLIRVNVIGSIYKPKCRATLSYN